MTDIVTDPEARYAGADMEDQTINKDGIHHYRIPVEDFPDEEARQQFAEQWLLVQFDFVKGRDYAWATISDDGRIIFQPLIPIEYLKFEMGVTPPGLGEPRTVRSLDDLKKMMEDI
jgi:hypothetical protein